jgi:Protein of unknown function (DUF3606)
MADNKKKRGGADRALIALGESYEVAYWSKKFKITPARLKAVVAAAGHSSKNVAAYLARKKTTRKTAKKKTARKTAKKKPPERRPHSPNELYQVGFLSCITSARQGPVVNPGDGLKAMAAGPGTAAGSLAARIAAGVLAPDAPIVPADPRAQAAAHHVFQISLSHGSSSVKKVTHCR